MTRVMVLMSGGDEDEDRTDEELSGCAVDGDDDDDVDDDCVSVWAALGMELDEKEIAAIVQVFDKNRDNTVRALSLCTRGALCHRHRLVLCTLCSPCTYEDPPLYLVSIQSHPSYPFTNPL
jgi:hypothetical protein